MKTKKIVYDDLIDIKKIKNVYHTIKVNTRHKQKVLQFEFYLTSNFINIENILESKNYKHGKYNIFLITVPKCRIIMSENMTDKIINHLVSRYVLFPLIEPKLINTNVATRIDKGSKAAIYYLKKYINSLKVNSNKIYALKCDITKYFYSIDHDILKDKIRSVVKDDDILNLIDTIIDSTDSDYINREIKRQINNYKKAKNYSSKFVELEKIPFYDKGKGLPIGNMSSQIMAIFYLSDIDHFIKEKLHIKCYIRYMDDFILLHPDKNYLKYCLCEIDKKIKELKLTLNNKTQIYEVHQGIPFIGYKFTLKDKRLIVTISSKTKKCIKEKIKLASSKKEKMEILSNYNGYLLKTDSGNFKYSIMKEKK